MHEQITPSPKLLAGFWIRVAADAIDMALLWVLGLLLGLVLESWFVKLGENGVWIGLLISIAYFVPVQSSFGNGQSLGKRLVGIQVLNMNGQNLSLPNSFLRYLVIAFVAYTGIFTGLVSSIVGSSLTTAANLIMVTFWIAVLLGCYFLLPLHPLKRGLHDLVAGSVVVYRGQFNATALAALENPAKTKKAYAIVGGICAVAIIAGVWGFAAIMKSSAIGSMQEIQAKLESTGRFHSTSVMDNTFRNSAGIVRSIVVQTRVDGPLGETREQLKPSYDIAFQTIRDQIKDLSQYQNLRVGLRLGYDLGIRKRYITFFEDENPSKPGERRDAGSNSNF